MNVVSTAQKLIRRFEGPLTDQLVLEPARFGLGKVPARLQPDSIKRSVCGFCATGCSLSVHLRQGDVVNLSPDKHYPVNLGMACPKGWEALRVLDAPNRARVPLLRNAEGNLKPVSWETALRTMCERFRDLQQAHGEDALAFLSTGQIPIEEMALLGSVAKFGMGIRHGDGNTRQCMATAVTAYKESFGFDAPPYTYKDFEESEVLVFMGSNPCIAHPIMWQRVMRNRKNPIIVVIDPRRTETAMAATHHLALRPKSDLTLLYGLANLVCCRGKLDTAFITKHTEHFEAFRDHVAAYDLDRVVEITGLSAAQIEMLADLIGSGRATSFWWTMGVNQSHEGTRVAQGLINLALMTGNIGKPGTGANSITGQCNAMGSRLFSNTTNLLGGRAFTNARHRKAVAEILDIPLPCIPGKDSWAYDQIIDGVDAGAVKGLWIIATNPAHSWINQNRLARLRKKLGFLVVQDMYADTETAQMADLVLPAAAWGEKEGTFINSERRLGAIRKVRKAPGEALADFYIFKLVAHFWGCADLFKDWTDPAAVFQILKRLSAGQPCDFSGIKDHAHLEASGGIQWPYRGVSEDNGHERRLFTNHRFFHANGKARFCFESGRQPQEVPDNQYPFWLLTGRGTSSQWHTQSRTRNSDVLRKLYPVDCYVEIHPEDARTLGIQPHDLVTLRSPRGQVIASAFLTATVQRGSVFLPMHYSAVNQLTLDQFDPHSRQPSYKACAVSLEKCKD